MEGWQRNERSGGDRRAMSVGRRAAHLAAGPGLGALTLGVSMLAAGVFLAHVYGFGHILSAVSRANIWLLAVVVTLGIVDQLLRARRAQLMLSHDREVTLPQSYGAMVVGHGVGDLVPLIPGGPALRCVLTERLARVPIAFSAGVYMLEGILDGLGPALITVYLLLVLALPGWTRWVLLGTLGQSVLLLLVPLLLWQASHRVHLCRLRRGRLAGLVRLGSQLAAGLQALRARGVGVSARVVALSLLITALAAAQLLLFLRAFALGTSANDLMLVLVLTLASGSMPIKFPGAGTLAAAAVLPLAGVHGPGLGGYILTSRLVFSSETVALAAALLAVWAATGHHCFAGLGELFHISRGKAEGQSQTRAPIHALQGTLHPGEIGSQSGPPVGEGVSPEPALAYVPVLSDHLVDTRQP